MTITVNTKVTIGDLTDWNLLWLCVDVEYDIIRKRLDVDATAAACDSIEGRRTSLMRQWNTIYDHPIGLHDELQKSPRWIKLDELLVQARHEAYDRSLNAHRDMLRTKLGIKGDKT